MAETSHSHSSMKVSLIKSNYPFPRRRRYGLFNHLIVDSQTGGDNVNDSCRFISMAVLTSTMMIAEIITGIVTGSLTLLSDALHMMSDLIALIIGFFAYRMANSDKSQDSMEHAMVYMRYEIVGALINGTILLTSCFIMGLEAIQRIAFFHEEIENVDYVLYVGGLGLFINLIGLCIFGHHGHSHDHHHHHDHSHTDHQLEQHNHLHDHHERPLALDKNLRPFTEKNEKNLNIEGVFLHILGDLLGSVAVMVSSIVIKFTEGWWTLYIDPVCTLLIVILISRTAWPLVKQSANILLDKSPFDTEVISQIEGALKDINGVLNVHELHCWEVKSGYYMASVHLIIDPNWKDDDHTDKYCKKQCNMPHDKMTIIDQAKAILHQFGVHSSIVQPEFPKPGDQDWKSAEDPCFDYVCDTSDCMQKSFALSNSMSNLKKQRTLADIQLIDDNSDVNDEVELSQHRDIEEEENENKQVMTESEKSSTN